MYTAFEVLNIMADLRRQHELQLEKYEEERLKLKRALQKAKLMMAEQTRRDHGSIVETLKAHIKELNQLRKVDKRTINELRFELLSCREMEGDLRVVMQKYEQKIHRLRAKIRHMKYNSHATTPFRSPSLQSPALFTTPCSPSLTQSPRLDPQSVSTPPRSPVLRNYSHSRRADAAKAVLGSSPKISPGNRRKSLSFLCSPVAFARSPFTLTPTLRGQKMRFCSPTAHKSSPYARPASSSVRSKLEVLVL